MPNPPGTPIWYELATPDPAGAKRFYDDLIGWSVETDPSGAIDYLMISGQGRLAGGVLPLTRDMLQNGAVPCWLAFFGVADVDATAEQASALGGNVLLPPTDLAEVGRFALLADPAGAMFYIMRPFRDDESSHVFVPNTPGRCGWNELTTPDAAAALAFYGTLFGWENRESMVSANGAYHYWDHAGLRLGGLAELPDRPARWNLYFTVPDIAAAVAKIEAAGGRIDMGPYQVPTGDQIIHGIDPQSAPFALVAPR